MRMLIGTILCLATLSAGAQLYRWTDAAGTPHFTDTLPPASARDVQKQNIPAFAPGEPFVLRQARDNFPISLYTTPGCAPCADARQLLNARGIPFTEVRVTQHNLAELKNAVGSETVPALVVGSTVQKGFEEGLYQRTLDAAGYPKPGVLPPRSQTEPKPDQPQAEEAPPALGPYAPPR